MSYIKQAHISNFQSHKDTVLDFHPGVNAIVGLSDAGKSALFRAIGWPITNRPRGNAFRSRWGGETSSALTFAENITVTRINGKENAYEIQQARGKALEFKAFKDAIPAEVLEVVDMDEINLQTQHDSPFLLSASPSEVAKVLNKVANLTSIDTAISNIRKKALSVSREITSVEDQIADLEKQEKSFSYLDRMEKDVAAWQELCNEQKKVVEKTSTLETLIEEIERDEKDLLEIAHLLSSEKKVSETVNLSLELEKLKEEQRSLLTLIREIEEQGVEINSFAELFEIEKDVQEILSMLTELEEQRAESAELSKLITELTVQEVRLDSDVVVIRQLEAEFKRNFPKVCPLCGGNK